MPIHVDKIYYIATKDSDDSTTGIKVVKVKVVSSDNIKSAIKPLHSDNSDMNAKNI